MFPRIGNWKPTGMVGFLLVAFGRPPSNQMGGNPKKACFVQRATFVASFCGPCQCAKYSLVCSFWKKYAHLRIHMEPQKPSFVETCSVPIRRFHKQSEHFGVCNRVSISGFAKLLL